MKPKRIQRKRSRGWKMPENTVYVGRPSKWGNPYDWRKRNKQWAVNMFRSWLKGEQYPELQEERLRILDSLKELRGKNLACWCKLGEVCHASVLLEMANL